MKHETRMARDPVYLLVWFTGGVYYYHLPGRGIVLKREFEPLGHRLERSVAFALNELTKTAAVIAEETARVFKIS